MICFRSVLTWRLRQIHFQRTPCCVHPEHVFPPRPTAIWGGYRRSRVRATDVFSCRSIVLPRTSSEKMHECEHQHQADTCTQLPGDCEGFCSVQKLLKGKDLLKTIGSQFVSERDDENTPVLTLVFACDQGLFSDTGLISANLACKHRALGAQRERHSRQACRRICYAHQCVLPH